MVILDHRIMTTNQTDRTPESTSERTTRRSRAGERPRRWTSEEDARLLQQIKVFPQNLSKCFNIVSEVIDRTPTACAARWYTVLSKDPANAAFLTVSSRHKILNRKNGEGTECSPTLFQRILRLLRLI